MHIHLTLICIKLTSLLQTWNSRKAFFFFPEVLEQRVGVYIVYFYILCLIADDLWLLNIMATKISTGMKNLMKGKENQSYKGKTRHECTIMMINYRLTDRRWIMEDTWPFRNQQDPSVSVHKWTITVERIREKEVL